MEFETFEPSNQAGVQNHQVARRKTNNPVFTNGYKTELEPVSHER